MVERIQLKDIKHESAPNFKSFMDLSQFIQPELIESGHSGLSKSKKKRKTKHKPESIDSEILTAKVYVVGREEHPKTLLQKCFPHQQKRPAAGYKIDVCRLKKTMQR